VQRGNPRLVATSSFYNVRRSKNGGGGRYGGVEREAHDWRGGADEMVEDRGVCRCSTAPKPAEAGGGLDGS
jgi:hypothetical protein